MHACKIEKFASQNQFLCVSSIIFSATAEKKQIQIVFSKKNVETSTKFDKKMPLNFTGFQRTRKLLWIQNIYYAYF